MCRILESGKNVVVDLGRAAGLPARGRPDDRRAARGGVPRRAARRASRRASTPASRTTSLPLMLTGRVRARRLGARDGDRQLRHLRPARRCCSTRWASRKPLDHTPLLLIPGVLSLAWGAVVHVHRGGARRRRSTSSARRTSAGAAGDAFDIPPGRVPAGTDRRAALRGAGHRARASRAIVVEHVTRLRDDLAPDWPQPAGLGVLPRRHRGLAVAAPATCSCWARTATTTPAASSPPRCAS